MFNPHNLHQQQQQQHHQHQQFQQHLRQLQQLFQQQPPPPPPPQPPPAHHVPHHPHAAHHHHHQVQAQRAIPVAPQAPPAPRMVNLCQATQTTIIGPNHMLQGAIMMQRMQGSMRGFAVAGQQQYRQFYAAGPRSSILGPIPMGVARKPPMMGFPPARHFHPHGGVYYKNTNPPNATPADFVSAWQAADRKRDSEQRAAGNTDGQPAASVTNDTVAEGGTDGVPSITEERTQPPAEPTEEPAVKKQKTDGIEESSEKTNIVTDDNVILIPEYNNATEESPSDDCILIEAGGSILVSDAAEELEESRTAKLIDTGLTGRSPSDKQNEESNTLDSEDEDALLASQDSEEDDLMEETAEDGKEKTIEEAKDKTIEEAKEKTIEEAKEKTIEEATDKTIEEAKEKSVEEAKEKTVEEAKEKSVEEAKEKTIEEAKEKTIEEAKQKAVEEAKQKTVEEAKQKAIEEAKQKAIEEAKQKTIEESKQKAIEEAKEKTIEEAKQKAIEEAKQKTVEEAKEKQKTTEETKKFYCYLCSITCHNQQNFQEHMIGFSHQQRMMEIQHMSNTCLVTLLPQVQESLRGACKDGEKGPGLQHWGATCRTELTSNVLGHHSNKEHKVDDLAEQSSVASLEYLVEEEEGSEVEQEEGQRNDRIQGSSTRQDGWSSQTDGDLEDMDSDEEYDTDTVYGSNFLIPVAGFLCRLCKRFYNFQSPGLHSHCKSLKHFQNLKKYRSLHNQRVSSKSTTAFASEDHLSSVSDTTTDLDGSGSHIITDSSEVDDVKSNNQFMRPTVTITRVRLPKDRQRKKKPESTSMPQSIDTAATAGSSSTHPAFDPVTTMEHAVSQACVAWESSSELCEGPLSQPLEAVEEATEQQVQEASVSPEEISVPEKTVVPEKASTGKAKATNKRRSGRATSRR